MFPPERKAVHASGEEYHTPKATRYNGWTAKGISWINQNSSSGFNHPNQETSILPNGVSLPCGNALCRSQCSYAIPLRAPLIIGELM
jgi:hypothetical protein